QQNLDDAIAVLPLFGAGQNSDWLVGHVRPIRQGPVCRTWPECARADIADLRWRSPALRTSECRPNPELNLQGGTGTTLDRTVEVEDEVGDLGAAKVSGVEQVEDLQYGFDHEFARGKRSGQAQVQRRERVVFSTQVALRDGAVGIDPILRR